MLGLLSREERHRRRKEKLVSKVYTLLIDRLPENVSEVEFTSQSISTSAGPDSNIFAFLMGAQYPASMITYSGRTTTGEQFKGEVQAFVGHKSAPSYAEKVIQRLNSHYNPSNS